MKESFLNALPSSFEKMPEEDDDWERAKVLNGGLDRSPTNEDRGVFCLIEETVGPFRLITKSSSFTEINLEKGDMYFVPFSAVWSLVKEGKARLI